VKTETVVKRGVSIENLAPGWEIVDSSGLLALQGRSIFPVYGLDGHFRFETIEYRLRENGEIVEARYTCE